MFTQIMGQDNKQTKKEVKPVNSSQILLKAALLFHCPSRQNITTWPL